MSPPNAIAAATFPDPYPYYRHLAVNQPLFYDPTLEMWIATSASAAAGVSVLLSMSAVPLSQTLTVPYRQSVNARIPRLKGVTVA